MKILSFFPVSKSPQSELAFSGGQRRFIEICKVWTTLGNEIHVITTEYAQRLFQEFDYQTPTYLYKPTSFRRLGLNDLVDIKKMLTKVPKRKFDLIYAPGETFMCVVASVLGKRELDVPVAASFNLFDPNEISAIHSFSQTFNMDVCEVGRKIFYFKSLPRRALVVFKRFLRNLLSKDIDLIFTVGSVVRDLLQKMGVSGKRIFVVGAGIDYDHIQTVGCGEKIYDACFMGSIIRRKGVIDLIESWRRVVGEKPDARLMIMGTGPKLFERNIRELVRKYGLKKNVTMAGFVPGERKYKIMKQSKVFVFPSYLETFGQAICEAMACGLPVVAYDLPVYEEWYGDCMLSVNVGDIRGLEEATLNLLEDGDSRKKMVNEGLKVAKLYSWDSVARYELEILAQKLLIS